MNQQPHIGYYLNDNGSRAIFAEQEFSHPGVTVTADSPGPEFAAFSSVDASDAVFVDSCGPCGEGTAPMGIATNDGQTLHRVGRVHRINLAEAASFVSTTDGWVQVRSSTLVRKARRRSPGSSCTPVTAVRIGLRSTWRDRAQPFVQGGVLGTVGANLDDSHPAVRRE